MERARSVGLPRSHESRPDLFGSEQLQILEQIARGAPLADVLRAIVSSIERHSDGHCSILLLDAEHGTLTHAAAPSLPAQYLKSIDGSQIGPAAGSCGSAAYLGERVIVGDIATHPFWTDYRQLALPFGLRACWATPILSQAREVLGTFAVYYGQPREPTPLELSLVDSATHLTSIAIMREHAEVEKKQLEAQVKLAQRMESLGTLAGGIAHEFNNILAGVIGYLELAQQELPAAHPVRERLDVVLSATDRAADLVAQILAFSRRREIQRLPITLQPVVEEALRLLRATLPAMVEIRASFPPQNLAVLADASQIHQILLNLATNAVHAMNRRGVLSFSLEPVTLREPLSAVGGLVPAGRYMRLALADDGAGMDAETLTRIFEPFFTTKQPGEGTGLGLSVVRGIVQEHGASLSVQSSLGVGTTFEIYFPEAASGTPHARIAAPHARVRSDRKRILCVDDEASILALETQVLEGLGYRVEGHTDPGEALRSFSASPSAFDAIVTDFGMLGMTGIELAREALRIRRDIPVVMTGGYLRPEEAEQARQVGVRELLGKPDVVDALPRSLARLLPEPN
jgi:signal transduction histidine kinase/ActR/RegA family two-component response regulator